MSKIVIITSSYPYPEGKEDSFLRLELEELCKRFEIILVPLKSKKLNRDKFLDKLVNIAVLDSFCDASFLKMAMIFIKDLAFLNTIFFKEIKGKSFNKMLKLFLYSIRTHWIKINLDKNMTNLIGDGSTIFYTYWFGQGTTALAELRRKYNFLIITRAHGSDFYLSQNNDYIPFRTLDLQCVDWVITISKMGESYLKNQYNLERVKTFYLGVPNPKAIVEINSNKTLRLVSCSNLIPLKRIDLIYDYLQRFSIENSLEIEWHHIGDGPLMHHFLSLTPPLDSMLKCCFVGSIPNSDIVKYYLNNKFDYFITLSSSEGLPVSLMEAYSCGLPCIATDVGGVSELVMNKTNGYLLSSSPDYNEFKQKLNEAIKNKSNILEYSNMKKKCYSIFEEKFDAVNNYKSFSHFLNSI